MLDIFLKIVDTILPPHPSVLKIRKETPEGFTRFFMTQRIGNTTSLSDYTQPPIKAAVTANKFYNSKKASFLLATLVEKWIAKQSNKPIIFVPIPLAKSRKRQRGYNQVTRVVKNVTKNSGSIENLLIRIKETEAQTKLDRSLRFSNIKNAFSYQPTNRDISKHHIVLIDDVITTGATMEEARKALTSHLPKDCEISCIAFAH
jgi:ComF family protein